MVNEFTAQIYENLLFEKKKKIFSNLSIPQYSE